MSANTPGQPSPRAGVSRNLTPPRVVLAIGAHPDDVEFGAGGTLAKWASGGCTVHHLILTDGSKGTWDPHADTAALVAVRRREQQDAARVLAAAHAGEVVMLGYVDGELDSGLAQRACVAEVIRRLRPDVVLGHDPWKRYRIHPDHRHAGLLACEGVVAARDPHFFPEQQLEPHRPDRLLLWEADEVDHYEDLTDLAVDTKLAALEAHTSQFRSTMHAVDQASLVAFRARIRAQLLAIGDGTYAAEAFHLIDDL